jgi:hypothetical protein
MRTILHIGLPKTGSTYLQEWLKLNKEKLHQSGIAILSSPAAHRLAVASLNDPTLDGRLDVMEIKGQCELADAIGEVKAKGDDVLVISSEYFYHCNPLAVRDLIDHAGGDTVISVTCFLRRQDRLCASGYVQEVKALGLSKRIPDYGPVPYTSFLDWNNLYETWSEAFACPIKFENFDACGADGELVSTFKRAIGIQHLDTEDLPWRVNEGLSAHLTEFARMMNERAISFDFDLMMKVEQKTALPKFSFDQHVTEMFEEIYRPSNSLLAQRFPGRFDDYSTSGWQPSGIDMTDKLDAEQQARILVHFVSLPAHVEEYRRRLRDR